MMIVNEAWLLVPTVLTQDENGDSIEDGSYVGEQPHDHSQLESEQQKKPTGQVRGVKPFPGHNATVHRSLTAFCKFSNHVLIVANRKLIKARKTY